MQISGNPSDHNANAPATSASRLNMGRLLTFTLICAAASTTAAPGGKNGSGGTQEPPTLEFAADQSSYEIGESATLRWSAPNTGFCSASGDWNGKLATEGSYQTAPLDGPKTYEIKCQAPGGGVSGTVALQVTEPQPDPAPGTDPGTGSPALSLSASQVLIPSGETATLTWLAENASACDASGGWTGSRVAGGSETVGPIYGSTAFTLSCEGAGATVVETVRIDVLGQITMQWDPPERNVDGSALTDLAGFDLYYGSASGAYEASEHIGDAGATSLTVTLPSGTYFFALTATDRDGNESGFSNEIQRDLP